MHSKDGIRFNIMNPMDLQNILDPYSSVDTKGLRNGSLDRDPVDPMFGCWKNIITNLGPMATLDPPISPDIPMKPVKLEDRRGSVD